MSLTCEPVPRVHLVDSYVIETIDVLPWRQRAGSRDVIHWLSSVDGQSSSPIRDEEGMTSSANASSLPHRRHQQQHGRQAAVKQSISACFPPARPRTVGSEVRCACMAPAEVATFPANNNDVIHYVDCRHSRCFDLYDDVTSPWLDWCPDGTTLQLPVYVITSFPFSGSCSALLPPNYFRFVLGAKMFDQTTKQRDIMTAKMASTVGRPLMTSSPRRLMTSSAPAGRSRDLLTGLHSPLSHSPLSPPPQPQPTPVNAYAGEDEGEVNYQTSTSSAEHHQHPITVSVPASQSSFTVALDVNTRSQSSTLTTDSPRVHAVSLSRLQDMSLSRDVHPATPTVNVSDVTLGLETDEVPCHTLTKLSARRLQDGGHASSSPRSGSRVIQRQALGRRNRVGARGKSATNIIAPVDDHGLEQIVEDVELVTAPTASARRPLKERKANPVRCRSRSVVKNESTVPPSRVYPRITSRFRTLRNLSNFLDSVVSRGDVGRRRSLYDNSASTPSTKSRRLQRRHTEIGLYTAPSPPPPVTAVTPTPGLITDSHGRRSVSRSSTSRLSTSNDLLDQLADVTSPDTGDDIRISQLRRDAYAILRAEFRRHVTSVGPQWRADELQKIFDTLFSMELTANPNSDSADGDLSKKSDYLQRSKQQPWTFGRLALSQRACRFELPMNLRLLHDMSPQEYMKHYCKISERRLTLYKKIFNRYKPQNSNGITTKELYSALYDVYSTAVQDSDVTQVCRLLQVTSSTDEIIDLQLFSAIAALTERLLYPRFITEHTKDMMEYKLNQVEAADFCGMQWKLDGVPLNEPMTQLLQALQPCS